jgi:hypothetical protein
MIRFAIGCVFIIVAVPAALIAAVWFSMSAADKDALGYYAMMGGYVAVGLAVVALGMFGNWRHAKREAAKLKMKDGAYDLWVERKHRWRGDLPWIQAVYSLWVGEKIIIDLNRTVSPAVALDAFGNFRELEPAGGWAMQHAYNVTVEATNVARAIAQGDDSRNNWFGRDSAPARIPARTLATRQPAPSFDEPPALTVAPEPALSPQAALERSSNGVVYIGQQREGGRSLARWDANSASTLGIFGATGTGKSTSIGTMATLAMVRWGWKLWILDGKDAGDWDEFSNHATVEAIGQHNIEDVMQVVWEEYQRRERLMSDNRWRRYADIPTEVQAEFPQWGMVFEEFGATRLGLHQKTKAQLDKFMGIMCQKARYTGWHGVFIDQRPSNYTNEMKGNLKSIACFQLMMNQGHAVNAYQADKLAPMGEFEMDGGRYWAFHAEPLARPVLATMPVRGAFVATPVANGYERVANGLRTAIPEANDTNVRETTPVTDAPTLVSIYERTRSWDAVAKSFFERDPEQTQSDLRRLMVLISADGRGPDAFKGEAYRLYHQFNPKGNSYRANQ